ncbi:autocrine proliferation repressor protein A-like [Pomacea canaliculata]|nr:autocrine proliferation repressor protein A-like [Pomacea canaliculata]
MFSSNMGVRAMPMTSSWFLRVLVLTALVGLHSSEATPLDDYVNRPDPHYSYNIIAATRGLNYTLYTVNMTSQMWKSSDVLNRPLWWHYLSITIPDTIRFDTAVLFIDGGSNDDGPPPPTDNFVALVTMVAASTGCVTANLKQIPNQPVVFKADPSQKQRNEDAVIAWTWKTFIENASDPEILLRMPMTKAVVRAMDTVTDVVNILAGKNVSKFLVAGASKRGWTTWTTASVDKRVVAIAPIVFDLLHLVKNLHHHFRAYGGWTFAFNDYYELNFTGQLDNPNTQLMADIIDPISYNDRLTIPKLVISTGGDEFFLPDDSHYYYDNLNQPTYLRILPNAEHSCAGHEISLFFDLRAFYLSVVTGEPLPKLSWTRQATSTGGFIRVATDRTPNTIRAYFAKTLDGLRRDFRLLVASEDDPTKPTPHPVVWHYTPVKALGNNTYLAEFDNPEEGWLAFFIQMTFKGVADAVLEFTTEAQIIPDTFPFPDCVGPTCLGTLV